MVANEKDGHTASGTHYGKDAASAYSQTTHHSDRQRFLSGYIEELLVHVEGRVIDIGSGLAPWSIYAAQHGASEVVSIDYQQDMVDKAKDAVAQAKLSDKIHVQKGDGAHLEFASGTFDTALSIQVGCNLPNAASEREGFFAHFSELSRVLRQKGKAVVTAPASFGIMFTGGTRSRNEVVADVDSRLALINASSDPLRLAVIQEHLTPVSGVFLATFSTRDGKVVRVSDESTISSGEEIWRKLPGLVVPNFYHSVQEYRNAFDRNELKILTEYSQGFSTRKELEIYNEPLDPESKLGEKYIANPPFAVWLLEKA